MSDTIHLEKTFEEYITDELKELGNGDWVISKNDDGFEADSALYFDDFIDYVSKVQPDKIETMKKNMGSNWYSNLKRSLVKALENEGTVQTLRNGFPMAGYSTIVCSGGIPDDTRIPDAQKKYDENILRVMRQVHYQTAGNKSLDLVFFINGIPVATAELKTDFTQTVQDAIEEYQTNRKPIEPDGRRKNPLLMYKRGAVVHFAISESEIYMYAGDLGVDSPKFLPFNKGNDGHAGNPPMQKDDKDYPTGYFWNEICQKENWVRIFHNFIFEEVSKKEDATGRLRERKTQLFPRYHQWSAVTKIVNDVHQNGVGQRYLIEHSAGSGKTETISWVAHELIRMMNDKGTDKLFSSVIVVTDRVNLDSNIKGTIKQLRKTTGLIEMVGGDDQKKTAGAKSKQLAKALKDKREIIVVTLQTFPYALDAIANEPSLKGSNFAVLIDEAHNSQEGILSGKMKAALKAASKGKEGIPTDEDAVNAYFQQLQSEKVMPSNVSFFAFTATPKFETMTLFGRVSDKIDEKTGKPIPQSFDKYPMRQAIEEGYIIDVLQGYMPYKTAYKLSEDVADKLVYDRAAIRTIARWASLHPTNVMSKAQFIVEHFVKNVAALLNNEAKAMIVTSSRASVIRYKYAIDAYLRAHPEYDRNKIPEHLQFKVPGDPLVAFSGSIKGELCVMPEDDTEEILTEHDYLKESPFAQIRRDYDYTEDNINNLGYKTIENAFDEKSNRLLIVANKFQVGFNQPKLCAMYIDKSIANDIEIVQTYSRLNRTYPGKDKVFIIDFVNDPEDVLRAFKKYDNGATITSTQDLDVIYTIKQQLDDADIYTNDEFEFYKKTKYACVKVVEEQKESYRKKLYCSVDEPVVRWRNRYQNAQTAYGTWKNVQDTAAKNGDKEKAKYAQTQLDSYSEELDKLVDFRKKLRKFDSLYTFVSQIIDFGDPDLEVFDGFAKMIFYRLSFMNMDDIDVRSLVLADYRIKAVDKGEGEEETAELKPISTGRKARSSKQESLKTIISKINEIWGEDIDTTTGARTINAIADYVEADDVSNAQIKNSTNTKDAVLANGRLDNIIRLAAISLMNNEFSDLAKKIVDDPQSMRPIAEIIYDLIEKKKRIDITDLLNMLKSDKS